MTAPSVPVVSEAISEERLRELPDLLEQAERRVNAHVFRTGGDDSLASIPANHNRDVDLLLMEAAHVIRELSRRAADALDSEADAWVPWKPGDAMPPSGSYLVVTDYNASSELFNPKWNRMQSARHTDDVAAWQRVVYYWPVRLPPPPPTTTTAEDGEGR